MDIGWVCLCGSHGEPSNATSFSRWIIPFIPREFVPGILHFCPCTLWCRTIKFPRCAFCTNVSCSLRVQSAFYHVKVGFDAYRLASFRGFSEGICSTLRFVDCTEIEFYLNGRCIGSSWIDWPTTECVGILRDVLDNFCSLVYSSRGYLDS